MPEGTEEPRRANHVFASIDEQDSAMSRGEGIDEMITSQAAAKRNVLAALLLPATLRGRLIFLGVIFFLAFGIVPVPYNVPIGIPLGILEIYVCVIAVKARRRRKKHLTLRRALTATVGAMAAYMTFITGMVVGTRGLAFMATGGISSGSGLISFSSGGSAAVLTGFWIQIAVMAAILWLLLWIPHRLFVIKLDVDGAEGVRHIVLGSIVAVASVLTGIYILLLHVGGGPLSRVPLGPLVAGTIGTVLLLAQAYRSLARACWRRGIIGIFHPKVLMQAWRNTATELGKALDRPAGPHITPSNAPDPEAGKTL